MLVARYCKSCIHDRSQRMPMTQTQELFRQCSLPLRETSSSLGLRITRGQRDHVIAPHSIFSWYVQQVSGQDRVSCTGQFIGSAHIAGLPEAITKSYGVFLRILTTITHICIGRDKGAAKVSSYTDIRII